MRPKAKPITTEIERYMAIPGQALSYKMASWKSWNYDKEHKTKWE
jgi:uncharacterized protein (DUF885 family)